LLRRRLAAIVGAFVAASPAIGADDALARLDAFVVGIGATEVCNPSFDWSRLHFDAAAVGQGAYDKLLSDLEAARPKDPGNPENADRALKLRTEEMLRQGAQAVAEKGCDDAEIRRLLKRLEGGS
jgi:hypothetical protein